MTAEATAAAGQPAARGEGDGHYTSLGVDNNKMGMWTLIGSECLFFGALIATYLVYLNRFAPAGEDGVAIDGPELFDIPFTSVSTFILLMSSLGVVLALSAIQSGDMRRFRTWVIATAIMGSVFLAGQIYEFTVFMAEGMTVTTSPFAAAFFVLTGFHGVHVFVGILMLVGLWASSFIGKLGPERADAVENVGLYWHFVDIVWIILFTVVYLIPAE